MVLRNDKWILFQVRIASLDEEGCIGKTSAHGCPPKLLTKAGSGKIEKRSNLPVEVDFDNFKHNMNSNTF